ncbi:MAG: adenine phosphoribosyltransferase [Rhizobiales bacterium]|nr:adenine phosphoribosyltransferase [Hyphomicrobiales bacterium]MBL6770387.1 adenine phosphoribosyltransferase [Hyphomicrobiales bacterium]
MNLLKQSIRSINDYPKPGIIYRDITPLLKSPDLFSLVIDMSAELADGSIDLIAAIDARGFIFGSALAQKLRKGFIPIRKRNKLPYKVISQEYSLEYGVDQLELHIDAITSTQKILLIDDVLATGGTAEASAKLVNQLGGEIVSMIFIIELLGLNGRQHLEEYSNNIHSLITY